MKYRLEELMSYGERSSYDDNQRFMVYEYWTETALTMANKRDIITLDRIPKHGCAYLIITPIDDKDLIFVNSTLHLIPGGPEFSNASVDEDKLHINFNQIGQRKGSLIFYSEKYRYIESDNFKTYSNQFDNGFLLTIELVSIPVSEVIFSLK